MSSPSVSRSPEHRTVLFLALAAPLALVSLGWFLRPDPRGWGTHEQLGFRPCLPMAHWNVPCPGCGVTTAVSLAVHGAPLASLRTQPFGLVTLACAFAAALWAVAGHVRRRDLRVELGLLPLRRLGFGLGALMLLAWGYKLAQVRGWS